jgi:23S rRNA (cytidine1920-2'-O)/16S rRNA (cytidine1409-2'-O)-methyltransferase
VLPAIVATVGTSIDAVLLVKPQFEVGRGGIREGIVRDRALRHEAVRDVVWAAWDAGLATRGIIASPVLGSNGNREYLLHLTAPRPGDPPEWDGAIAALP